MVIVSCDVCGKTIKRKPSRLKKFRHSFCSRDCCNIFKLNFKISKEELEDLYWNRGLTQSQIAKLKGVRQWSVWNRMEKLGIPTQPRSEAHRGWHHNEETKMKLSMMKKGVKNPFYGKHHAIKWKKRLSERNRGKGNPMYGKGGKKSPRYGKKHTEETRVKMSRAAKERNQIHNIVKNSWVRPTRPEKQLIEIVKKFNLPFRYTGNGSFWVGNLNPDFVSTNGGKSIIEVYGDYWHRNDDPQERINFFERFGYKSMIIWEHELKELSDEEVADKIRAFDGL